MRTLDYSESELCIIQAELFEMSVEKASYSSLVFIRRFMLSNFVGSLDNKSYLFQSNNPDYVFEVLDKEYGESEYGSQKYDSEVMYWVGYMYRTISFLYNLSSKQVYRLFPAKEIINCYQIYNSVDIMQAAKRMMDNIGYIKPEDYTVEGVKILRGLLEEDK